MRQSSSRSLRAMGRDVLDPIRQSRACAMEASP